MPLTIHCFPGSGAPYPTTSADLVGRVFGQLTVTALKGRSSSANALVWVTLCDCGELSDARTYDLTSGKKASCGCTQRLKQSLANRKAPPTGLVGQKFGLLTVVARESSVRTLKKIVWQCLCACGRTTYEGQTALVSGGATSCGCEPLPESKLPPKPKPKPTPRPTPLTMQQVSAWTEMWAACADPADPTYMVEPGWEPCADPDNDPDAPRRTCWRDSSDKLQTTRPDLAPPARWRDVRAFAADVGVPASEMRRLGRRDPNLPHGPGNSAWVIGR